MAIITLFGKLNITIKTKTKHMKISIMETIHIHV